MFWDIVMRANVCRHLDEGHCTILITASVSECETNEHALKSMMGHRMFSSGSCRLIHVCITVGVVHRRGTVVVSFQQTFPD